jgi:hypothetical protein
VVAIIAGSAGEAVATIEPVVQDNIPLIAEHGSRGGAVAVPGVDCGTRCADLWAQEHRPIANAAASEQLHRELRTFRSRALKVLPKLRVLGTVGLGISAADALWKIGSGANAKYLIIGIPQAGEPRLNYRWNKIVWTPANSLEYAGARFPALDGWVIWLRQTCCWYFDMERWFNSECPFSGFAPPAPFGVRGPVASNAQCAGASTPSGYADVSVYYGWSIEDGLRARGPIEDYTGQPYGYQTPAWPDTPTDRAQLETRSRTALESDEYPMLDLWYAHLLDPQNYPDPTTTTQHDHRCDLDQPTYKNPGGNSEPAPLVPKDPIPYLTTGRPSGAPGAPDPYLRWGTTRWGGDYLDNWLEWGWRHIRAKHGWSEGPALTTDEGATRATLAAPVATVEGADHTSLTYTGSQIERNGALCTRVVVVQYEPKTGDIDPYGIITSYERFDGEAG